MATFFSILFLCAGYALAGLALLTLFPALSFWSAVGVLVLFALGQAARHVAAALVAP